MIRLVRDDRRDEILDWFSQHCMNNHDSFVDVQTSFQLRLSPNEKQRATTPCHNSRYVPIVNVQQTPCAMQ